MRRLGKFVLVSLLFSIIACTAGNNSSDKTVETKIDGKEIAIEMGQTVLNKYPDMWSIEGGTKPKWSYTYGLVSLGMLNLWEYTDNQAYYDYAKAYADSLIQEDGIIKTYKRSDFNIDKLNSGKMLFYFYHQTKEGKYKIAMDTLRNQLNDHPQTTIGGFWHKKRYPSQMWLDGLYMGGPFYAQYVNEFGDSTEFDHVSAWYINMETVARDDKTGLLFHGWDESKEQAWANKETGLSTHFWGRGMGWYGMALVDLLDYLPNSHPNYDTIVAIINRMATAIVKVQDAETGVWYQVLDQGDREGNYLEGSVSSMFSYFLLKAINKGYIAEETFGDSAKKAFEGTVTHLTKTNEQGEIIITPVCAVAGLGGNPYRDGSYDYYINEKQRDNDPKAVGPFIMAAIQYDMLTK